MDLNHKKGIFEAAVISTALLILIQLLMFISQSDPGSTLRDPDAYSWLNRVMLLHEGGDWFDFSNPRINPPEGLEQQWSHPFDLILFAGAWIGSHFIPFDAALYGWSILASPFLQVLSLAALFWALRPIMNDIDYFVLGFIFLTQMAMITTYGIGRPDHQLLLNLLFILSIGLTTRLLLYSFQWRYCAAAGLVSAIGMWVSVETLLVILVMMVCLGCAWLSGGRGFSKKALYYSLSLTIFSSLFLLAENGVENLFLPVLDQLSYSFIFLFILIVFYWVIVNFLEASEAIRLTLATRLFSAVTGSIVILFLMEMVLPGFFSGPAAEVDELYNQTRRHSIGEALPLVNIEKVAAGDWRTQLVRFSYWMGIFIPALPVLLLRLWKTPDPKRWFWVILLVAAAVFVPLTFMQLRWIHYAVVILIPPYVWLISHILDTLELHLSGWKLSSLRILVILLSAAVFILPGALVKQDATGSGNTVSVADNACPVTKISKVLDDVSGLGDKPRKIIAFVDYGPELLFRTNHTVYSIPNHRFQSGYSNSYNILTAENDHKALEIVERLQPDLILLCPEKLKDNYYARRDGKETLYQRLARGDTPQWLVEYELPEEGIGNFKIYKIQILTD